MRACGVRPAELLVFAVLACVGTAANQRPVNSAGFPRYPPFEYEAQFAAPEAIGVVELDAPLSVLPLPPAIDAAMAADAAAATSADAPDAVARGWNWAAAPAVVEGLGRRAPWVDVLVGGVAAIRRVNAATGRVEVIAGSTTGERGFADGAAEVARFRGLEGMQFVNGTGYVFATDFLNHRIRRLDLRSMTVVTVAGTGVAGCEDSKRDALSATLSKPIGLLWDGQDSLYFTQYGHVIRRFYFRGYERTLRPRANGAPREERTAVLGVAGQYMVVGDTDSGAIGSAANARLNRPWHFAGWDTWKNPSTTAFADMGNHKLRALDVYAAPRYGIYHRACNGQPKDVDGESRLQASCLKPKHVTFWSLDESMKTGTIFFTSGADGGKLRRIVDGGDGEGDMMTTVLGVGADDAGDQRGTARLGKLGALATFRFARELYVVSHQRTPSPAHVDRDAAIYGAEPLPAVPALVQVDLTPADDHQADADSAGLSLAERKAKIRAALTSKWHTVRPRDDVDLTIRPGTLDADKVRLIAEKPRDGAPSRDEDL